MSVLIDAKADLHSHCEPLGADLGVLRFLDISRHISRLTIRNNIQFSNQCKHFLAFCRFFNSFQCFFFCFGFAFSFSGLTPLSGVSAMASSATVKAMLEARCDPNPEPRGIGHGTSNEFGKKNIGRTTMSEWVYYSFI